MMNTVKIFLAVFALMAAGSMFGMKHDAVTMKTEAAPNITIKRGDKIRFPGYGVPMIVNRRILVLYDVDTIDANKDIDTLPLIKRELEKTKKMHPKVRQVLYVLLKRDPSSLQSEIFRKIDVYDKGLEANVPDELYDVIFR